jgi:hypothetical protein
MDTAIIILTGLVEADALIHTSSDPGHAAETSCPLTMESVYAKNDAQFLKETAETIAKNPLFVSSAAWEQTVRDCEDVEDMGAIKIKKCGHEFSAVPLLYEVMTKVFKCPICRGGSETEIDLDKDNIPANMPRKTWKILCSFSKHVRDEDKRQKRIEENTFPLDMQMISVVDMYDSLPWQMSFSLYRTENPSTNERPFVIIPIQMRMETHIMIGEDGVMNNTEIILRSGD